MAPALRPLAGPLTGPPGGGLLSPQMIRAAARIQAMRRRQAAGPADDPRLYDPRLKTWQGFAAFCDRHLRVVDIRKRLVPFTLNRMQRRIVAAELRARRAGRPPWFIILKYRKGGVTTLEQALAYWQCWREQHQECLTLAHEPKQTRIIFRMVSRFYDHQPEGARHRKTDANVMHIEFPHPWDSMYMAATAGRGGLEGRGATLSRVHLSEAAFYPSLSDTFTALSESVGPESAFAIESTANGRAGKGAAFHEFWKKAKRGESEFVPLFFPWHAEPENALALADADAEEAVRAELASDEEARDLVKRFRLSLAQIAWWLRKRRRLIVTGASGVKVHQEHPSDDDTCFLLGYDSYFDPALLGRADVHTREPLAVEDHGRLRLYEVPDPDEPATYVIGADPAGGVGEDDSAAYVINTRTGQPAASYTFNRLPPDVFGSQVLAGLGRRFANPSSGVPAYQVVEANNHGHATLTGLIKIAQYPIDRIYHHTDETQVDAHGRPKPSKYPGFNTNTRSRMQLATAIGEMLRTGDPAILDPEVVASIRDVGTAADGTPEFTGRDLAVAAGLAAIGLPYAAERSRKAYLGGQVVDLDGDA